MDNYLSSVQWYIVRDHFQVSAYNIDDINSPAIVMTLLTSQIDMCFIIKEHVCKYALCGENLLCVSDNFHGCIFSDAYVAQCWRKTTHCAPIIGDIFRYYTLKALLGYYYHLWYLPIL